MCHSTLQLHLAPFAYPNPIRLRTHSPSHCPPPPSNHPSHPLPSSTQHQHAMQAGDADPVFMSNVVLQGNKLTAEIEGQRHSALLSSHSYLDEQVIDCNRPGVVTGSFQRHCLCLLPSLMYRRHITVSGEQRFIANNLQAHTRQEQIVASSSVCIHNGWGFAPHRPPPPPHAMLGFHTLAHSLLLVTGVRVLSTSM